MLLDLAYWFGKGIEKEYYDLLKYYKKIDLDVAKDYERFYLEIINEEEEWVMDNTKIDKSYSDIIENIKNDVTKTQLDILINANVSLVKLYFRIGKILILIFNSSSLTYLCDPLTGIFY